MTRGFFVTGTDTGCGKTVAACALVHALRARGLRIAALKPVASGAERTPDGPRNADALALMQAGDVALPYTRVNRYCFLLPIAPHLAAAEAGEGMSIAAILENYHHAAARADCVIVEGAGGWLTPLDDRSTLADLARALDLDVILVVGLRLGCLSHALLTAQSIAAQGCTLAGWIGCHLTPDFDHAEANLATLSARLPAPCLGVLPYLDPPEPTRLALVLQTDKILSNRG